MQLSNRGRRPSTSFINSRIDSSFHSILSVRSTRSTRSTRSIRSIRSIHSTHGIRSILTSRSRSTNSNLGRLWCNNRTRPE